MLIVSVLGKNGFDVFVLDLSIVDILQGKNMMTRTWQLCAMRLKFRALKTRSNFELTGGDQG